MLDKKFYKLIISDIDMPELDGLSFFQKAAEKFPRLSGKFLFMTGNISQEREFFFKENNIEYLEKPMGINELREKSLKIILSASDPDGDELIYSTNASFGTLQEKRFEIFRQCTPG